MRLGFIGTGTITSAMVRGLKGSTLTDWRVVVSPRGAATARALATLPGVSIAADNQAVVDGAEIIVLAIRPQQAEAALRGLTIPADRRVLSLIAGLPIATIRAWTGAATVVRAVPLPFVERRADATPVHPPEPWALALFDALGRALPVEDIALFDVYAAASALMGSYFGLVETALTWTTSQGLPEVEARAYLATLFANLGQVLADSPEHPATLRRDHSTPGGMNEKVWAGFAAAEGPLALTRALDSVLARIRGH